MRKPKAGPPGMYLDPETFAVMTVDPGGVTGIAQGVFIPGPLGAVTMAGTIRGHRLDTREVHGGSLRQADEIARLWTLFKLDLERAGVKDVVLVIESFALRQRSVELSPVEITWALLGQLKLRDRDRVLFQSPAQAKGFATTARLKTWGLYSFGRGSDHKRDALRHLALAVANRLELM